MREEASGLPPLSSLAIELDSPLTILDIGCRWGFEEKWRALGSQVRLIGFDADAAECRVLNEQAGDGAVRYVAAALGASPGPATLYLTREPACGSLYPPDPELIEARKELECTALVSTAEVELTTLDVWAAEAGVHRVDAIKLDTQGSELDILRGAQRLLGSVRALEIEVELNPIYQGQPLFGDVDRFLREHDFVLWRLGHLVHYGLPGGLSQVRIEDRQFFDSQPVTFQGGGGQLFWAHAFYVRREMAFGPFRRGREIALRDACIARILGFDDLAAYAWQQAGAG
jgi:FkbM family methyltransferase